jgi:hypothetical protein
MQLRYAPSFYVFKPDCDGKWMKNNSHQIEDMPKCESAKYIATSLVPNCKILVDTIKPNLFQNDYNSRATMEVQDVYAKLNLLPFSLVRARHPADGSLRNIHIWAPPAGLAADGWSIASLSAMAKLAADGVIYIHSHSAGVLDEIASSLPAEPAAPGDEERWKESRIVWQPDTPAAKRARTAATAGQPPTAAALALMNTVLMAGSSNAVAPAPVAAAPVATMESAIMNAFATLDAEAHRALILKIDSIAVARGLRAPAGRVLRTERVDVNAAILMDEVINGQGKTEAEACGITSPFALKDWLADTVLGTVKPGKTEVGRRPPKNDLKNRVEHWGIPTGATTFDKVHALYKDLKQKRERAAEEATSGEAQQPALA